MQRRRFHRFAFGLAAAYNVAWSIHATIQPQWFFRFSGLPDLNHPSIYQCLAMVIGLYGALYAFVAWRPEDGWPLAAVGLAGKILGPIGLLVQVIHGGWPPRTFVLILTNDIIWWIPFALYLHDAWPSFRRQIARG